MRYNINWFLLIILGLFSCAKESMDVNMGNSKIIDIGEYKLLQSSIDTLPYLGKKGIVFVDSVLNQIVLNIQEWPIKQIDEAYLYHYNVFELGDTVMYKYSSQSKNFSIKNDSIKIEFIFSLDAKPYYSNPKSKYIADVISIYQKDPKDSFLFRGVFYHEINTRTWPTSWNNDPISEKIIINRKFKNVLYNDYTDPLSVINFNYEFGIVSFTDLNGKLWRFDRFI